MTLPMATGCGIPSNKPTFAVDKEMFIGAYCAPFPSDKSYREAAECEITHIFVGGGDYYKTFRYAFCESLFS